MSFCWVEPYKTYHGGFCCGRHDRIRKNTKFARVV